jgi:hypothetical protein
MHNITQCVREHQAVHNNNAQNIRNNEMNALQAKYEGLIQSIDEFKNGIKDTYITTADINDLVNDIKDSLIMLMNTTPRTDLDKIATLEERLHQLEIKQEDNEKATMLDDIRMPIKINVRETPHEPPKIPKIDLKKRKIIP